MVGAGRGLGCGSWRDSGSWHLDKGAEGPLLKCGAGDRSPVSHFSSSQVDFVSNEIWSHAQVWPV
jgi:hypothetical protein